MTANADHPFSGDPAAEDILILVDAHDHEIGGLEKHRCHQGDGVLHRAFSIFLFRPDGSLILQQRSDRKPLWPGFWSNSCCSHPRQGESIEDAVVRRLEEELGVKAPLHFLYKFEYQAHYRDIGSEHELCSVFVGVSDAPLSIDPAEIAATREVRADALDDELESTPEKFSPWFRLEWPDVREAVGDVLDISL